jgi:beta-D-xylosidase 4
MGCLFLISTLVSCAVTLVSSQNYSFPDCTKPPLSTNTVCDTSKDVLTRATAIVSLFTPEELMNNTINTSPGVPRLGLPPYQWWSEALVSDASI